MAKLQHMPNIDFTIEDLLPFGRIWLDNDNRFPRKASMDFTHVFDWKVGTALAEMLGNIQVVELSQNNVNPPLNPGNRDCVEVGPCRVVGGIRSQNFDVGYRPDGIRIAFDSKTLNDSDSVKKNFLNMVNDLGAESAFVHERFPYAVIAFIVAIPSPCLVDTQQRIITSTLERLTGRKSPDEVYHKAEAIAFIIWNPSTGEIDSSWPEESSPIRIGHFSQQIEDAYVLRYGGMLPHQ